MKINLDSSLRPKRMGVPVSKEITSLAELFKELRLGAGMKQIEAGHILGVKASTISKYERGDLPFDFKALEAIARVAGAKLVVSVVG